MTEKELKMFLLVDGWVDLYKHIDIEQENLNEHWFLKGDERIGIGTHFHKRCYDYSPNSTEVSRDITLEDLAKIIEYD